MSGMEPEKLDRLHRSYRRDAEFDEAFIVLTVGASLIATLGLLAAAQLRARARVKTGSPSPPSSPHGQTGAPISSVIRCARDWKLTALAESGWLITIGLP